MYPYNVHKNIKNISTKRVKNVFNSKDKSKEVRSLKIESDIEKFNQTSNNFILDLIKEAICDETRDSIYYEELSRKISNPEDQEILRKIHLDEEKHKKIFSELYKEISGKECEFSFSPKNISDNMLQNFSESLISELETVEFYRKILFSFLDLTVTDLMYEIITDEQAHAQKLNYLYSKYR